MRHAFLHDEDGDAKRRISERIFYYFAPATAMNTVGIRAFSRPPIERRRLCGAVLLAPDRASSILGHEMHPHEAGGLRTWPRKQ
jgi:hypothetical protein